MKPALQSLRGSVRLLVAIAVLAVIAAGARTLPQDSPFTSEPKKPTVAPRSGADEYVPDQKMSKVLIAYPEPRVQASVGQGQAPYTDPTYMAGDGNAVPPAYEIVPYFYPGPSEDYLRPGATGHDPAHAALEGGGHDWLWRLRVYTQWTTQAAIRDATGDLASYRFGADFGADVALGRNTELQFELGSRYTRYDLDGLAPLSLQQDVWNDYVNLRYFQYGLDNAAIMAFASGLGGETENANWSDGLYGKIGGGAQVRVNDRLAIGAAVGVMSQLEGKAAIWPIPWITWEIAADWRLYTDWNREAGLILAYNPDAWTSYRLKGFYDLSQYRLAPSGAVPAGAVTDERVGFSVGAEWKTSDYVSLWVDAGVFAYQDFEVHSQSGGFVNSAETDPAPFLEAGVSVMF